MEELTENAEDMAEEGESKKSEEKLGRLNFKVKIRRKRGKGKIVINHKVRKGKKGLKKIAMNFKVTKGNKEWNTVINFKVNIREKREIISHLITSTNGLFLHHSLSMTSTPTV